MVTRRDHILLAWKTLFQILDPFDSEVQKDAMREALNNGFKVAEDFSDRKEIEPAETDDVHYESSDDEDKDECAIIEEIRQGTSRQGSQLLPKVISRDIAHQ
jgi:hypothetical protein